MNNILRDMDALCQLTAEEREKRYRASCRMAKISEILLSGDEVTCDGGTKIRIPIEGDWKEQQLTDEEMDKLRGRDIVAETFDEILKNMVDELQDMVELFESMNMTRDRSIDDVLNQLEASISVYNEGT